MMEMVNNRVLILTGGNIDINFLKEWLKTNHYDSVIGVDRGLEAADELDLAMNFIVGDFDSVSEDRLEKFKNTRTEIHRHNPEKDQSDTQLAIELALLTHPSQIHIIGATGNRLDHVMANIHLLLQPMKQNVPTFIIDPNNKIYLQQESFIIQKERQYGSFLSFLPFMETVKGLTLEGVKYPLKRVQLLAGTSLCISNEILEKEAKVTFEEGILLVFESKD